MSNLFSLRVNECSSWSWSSVHKLECIHSTLITRFVVTLCHKREGHVDWFLSVSVCLSMSVQCLPLSCGHKFVESSNLLHSVLLTTVAGRAILRLAGLKSVWNLLIYTYASSLAALPIEIVIKFLESRLTIFNAHTNVIKITIPKKGGHFERWSAIGRRNTPHHRTSLYHAHS